jgi:hypothetical protein
MYEYQQKDNVIITFLESGESRSGYVIFELEIIWRRTYACLSVAFTWSVVLWILHNDITEILLKVALNTNLIFFHGIIYHPLSRYERPNTVIQFQLFYKYKKEIIYYNVQFTTVNEKNIFFKRKSMRYWHQFKNKSVKYSPFYLTI